MATNYLSLRLNDRLKEDFYAFCKKKRIPVGMLIKLLAKEIIEKGEPPFSVMADKNYPDDNLIVISIRIDPQTKENFSAACDKFGLPMSVIIRAFMDYCITNNSIPFEIGVK